MPPIQGYNSWPFDSDEKSCVSHAVLDTGANSTYINNRQLLENMTPPSAPSVMVVGWSIHPIEASGTLVGFPSIHADFVPALKLPHWYFTNFVYCIITNDKMILLKNTPPVDFVIQFSDQNNLMIMSGL